MALAQASQKAMQYEYQMRELEVKLSESLSNFRAIDSLIQESYNGIQLNTRRAERACQTQVPHIKGELDESLKVLSDLADTLPTIQSQLAEVRVVYDSGRQKVSVYFLVSLVEAHQDLRWLNTEFYERWRRIIFTKSSPVSWRWKAVMRVIFAFWFIIGAHLFWILLMGAYRAHRHRLVWGEKLMS
ncbi:hypothetical protein H0H92_012766 [Tricholoma furcatifolium]|nr:hypothetical protein H0H92_012766 [Tricholoma furcatifolium]